MSEQDQIALLKAEIERLRADMLYKRDPVLTENDELKAEIERLRLRAAGLSECGEIIAKRADDLQAKLATAVKALEWYATAEDDGEWVFGNWETNLQKDAGKLARAALKEIGGSDAPTV